jgi:tetrahydrodipicolinate N-succinyltransferase
VQAKDFTTAMAKPFAALKSNNLEIVNSYVKNSLLSSQQSCSTKALKSLTARHAFMEITFIRIAIPLAIQAITAFRLTKHLETMVSTIK